MLVCGLTVHGLAKPKARLEFRLTAGDLAPGCSQNRWRGEVRPAKSCIGSKQNRVPLPCENEQSCGNNDKAFTNGLRIFLPVVGCRSHQHCDRNDDQTYSSQVKTTLCQT
jgi:hypothetical protein